MQRLYFDQIDSVGTFPDDRIKMDIVFQDSSGDEYVWTPKWEEVMSIYAESERVEELNLAGGEWLDELKEKKQFSLEVLDEIAAVIANDRSTDEIADFFKAAGFPDDSLRYNLGPTDPLKSQVESRDNRVGMTRRKLEELNDQDYRHVIQAIQKAADPKQFIGEDDAHQEAITQLNQALEHEHMEVTQDGRVLPLEQE